MPTWVSQTFFQHSLAESTIYIQSILQLQKKFTTEQDTVQINALDFDLDIDGPNPPKPVTTQWWCQSRNI